MEERNGIIYSDIYQDILPGLKPDIDRKLNVFDRSKPPPYSSAAVMIGRGFQGRRVSVGTTPVLILPAGPAWPHIIKNPSRLEQIPSTGTVYSGTVNADGNSQSTPIEVANYMSMHLHLDVTSLVGGGGAAAAFSIYARTRDPLSLNWTRSQRLFMIDSTGTQYAMIGELGVVTHFAIEWDQISGTMTFTLSYTMKGGTVGSPDGLFRTLYIGPNSQVTTTTGYPLLEGEKETFIVADGAEIWGVSETPINVMVFKL